VLVEVDDVGLGGGGGDTTPGESIIPANAGMARTAVTIATAHVLRNVFTVFYLQGIHYFVIPVKIQNFLHQAQNAQELFLADVRKLS